MAYNGHVSYLVCGVLLHLDPPLGAFGGSGEQGVPAAYRALPPSY
jgi:hypothetical protein